ncbi:MAG TPA: tetratricopeptide repeat protein [Longimicrobium sp.]|nr:tetratricopeptide repeat protein [Longimicrobium sp.]
MKALRLALAAVLLPALGGCLATKQDLETLRTQIDADRASDRAAQQRQIDLLLSRTQAMLDSLSSQNTRMRADFANRLLAVDRQLVQIQALGGQSQQQIRDLQRQLEQRAAEAREAQADADSAEAAEAARPRPAPAPPSASPERPAATRPPADTARRTPPRPTPPRATPRRADGAPTADEAYEAAMGAYRRGSLSTAREGFQEFLRIAPSDERAPDAQFYVGESYSRDPDAAIAAYQRVVERWPSSPRASAALLRIAKLEIARGDRTQARAHLNQILRSYPRSDEAEEARTQLDRLGTR